MSVSQARRSSSKEDPGEDEDTGPLTNKTNIPKRTNHKEKQSRMGTTRSITDLPRTRGVENRMDRATIPGVGTSWVEKISQLRSHSPRTQTIRQSVGVCSVTRGAKFHIDTFARRVRRDAYRVQRNSRSGDGKRSKLPTTKHQAFISSSKGSNRSRRSISSRKSK